MISVPLDPVATSTVRIRSFATWAAGQAIAVEDLFVALALAAMMLLPIAEMVLRALFEVGIENINSLVQHITLAVATIGAAVAAREKRLLAFAGISFLPKKAEQYARFFSNTVAAVICVVLFVSSLGFVETERAANIILAYGVPVWMAQLSLPVAFALITIHMINGASKGMLDMVFSVCMGIALLVFLKSTPVPSSGILIIMFVLLLCAAILGAPVFAVVAGAALILMWSHGIPLAAMVLDHYSLVSNHLLPSIPLFTLAGYFLAESRAPHRLIELFDACFGRLPGGPVIATVLAATFFTSFTGASGVAILALGGLMMPLLVGSGYREQRSLGLITGGGSAGVLLMPALPLILYAIIANITIEEMFLAGLLPAMLMFTITVLWGIRMQSSVKGGVSTSFNTKRALNSVWAAKWELFLPLVLMSGMFSGKMTPLEASAMTAFYAFIVEVVIHRDLSMHEDVPRVLVDCGMLVGGILLILGVALGLTNYMVDAQISEIVVEWVRQSVEKPWIFLLALNGFLLVIGCFIDIYSAIIVLAPLIAPIGLAYG
ncbi:MAG: TRAP transporter large permease subunit, partial [Gammaproteobacteria bacterium]|nr:TRAP transporter large permease subunit [Gammaproteobacteria bacterium]